MEVTLDLETIGVLTDKQINFAIKKQEHLKGATLKPTALEEFVEVLVKDAPLKPQTSKIIALAWSTSTGKTYVETGTKEKLILKKFSLWLKEHERKVKRWVSFNGKKFDWPMITIRSAINNVPIAPSWSRLTYPFENQKHCDLYQVLGSSLSWNLEAFVLEMKPYFGFDAQKLYKRKKYEELKTYVKEDVRLTTELYLKVRDYI